MYFTKTDKTAYLSGGFTLTCLLLAWGWSVWFVTAERLQGNVYRILYLHVPSAICAFFCSLLLFVLSLFCLLHRFRPSSSSLSFWCRSTAEIGLLFTILTLVTGSIWGKPTWGTWWTWDARLTTTFILALLYCGYLLLSASLPAGSLQQRVCAVMGILVFVDVPIIYKSVTWWRTLHQPPSLSLTGSVMMDGEILRHLLLSMALMLTACLWLIWQRSINLRLQAEFEKASFALARKDF